MVVEVALGDEADLADVALEWLLAVMLDPDVLVNTVQRKKSKINNQCFDFDFLGLKENVTFIETSPNE